MTGTTTSARGSAPRRRYVAGFAAIGVGLVLCLAPARAAQAATLLPAPGVDPVPHDDRSQTAGVAGGCFWGIQTVFEHVTGATRVVAGYSGGADTAAYETVSTRAHEPRAIPTDRV